MKSRRVREPVTIAFLERPDGSFMVMAFDVNDQQISQIQAHEWKERAPRLRGRSVWMEAKSKQEDSGA